MANTTEGRRQTFIALCKEPADKQLNEFLKRYDIWIKLVRMILVSNHAMSYYYDKLINLRIQ